MSGEIASRRLGRATAAVCALALALTWPARTLADGPGGSTWFGTPLNVFTGAATGYESVWFHAAYTVTQRNGFDLPPLVTTNPAGTPLDQAGRLDTPSTTILAGNLTAGDDWRSGYELDAGLWLNPCAGTALIADYFNGGRDTYGFRGGRSEQILAQPFFNAPIQDDDAFLANFPTDRLGFIGVLAFEDFHSAGAVLQTCLWSSDEPWSHCDGARVSLFGGYRFYHDDSAILTDFDTTFVAGNGQNAAAGTEIFVNNKFAAENEFHGFEIGLNGRMQNDIWWVDGLIGLALGGNQQTAFVEGVTINVSPLTPDDPFIADGGGLVSRITNYGRYDHTDTELIPRFRLGAGVQLTERISARLGYNLIVWNGVVQAADTLPEGLRVDPNNLPEIQPGGGPDPLAPRLHGTTMVSHGLDLGLEVWF